MNDDDRWDAFAAIVVPTFIGFLLGTLYMGAFPNSSREIILGIYYVQFLGAILGFVTGVLLSAFFVKASFLEKIKNETFSFIALIIAFFSFFGNIFSPQFASEKLVALTTIGGQKVAPSEPVLIFSILISIFLAIIITALVFGILDSTRK